MITTFNYINDFSESNWYMNRKSHYMNDTTGFDDENSNINHNLWIASQIRKIISSTSNAEEDKENASLHQFLANRK